MMGGKPENDEQGFVITFNGPYALFHVNKGSEGEWKANAEKCITYVISAELNSRLADPEGDSEVEEAHQTDNVRPAAPHGIEGAVGPEGTAAKEGKTHTKKKKRGRKDLFGIGNAIGTFATNALTKSRGAFILEKTKQILTDGGVNVKCEERKGDPIKQHRVQSIIV